MVEATQPAIIAEWASLHTQYTLPTIALRPYRPFSPRAVPSNYTHFLLIVFYSVPFSVLIQSLTSYPRQRLSSKLLFHRPSSQRQLQPLSTRRVFSCLHIGREYLARTVSTCREPWLLTGRQLLVGIRAHDDNEGAHSQTLLVAISQDSLQASRP